MGTGWRQRSGRTEPSIYECCCRCRRRSLFRDNHLPCPFLILGIEIVIRFLKEAIIALVSWKYIFSSLFEHRVVLTGLRESERESNFASAYT